MHEMTPWIWMEKIKAPKKREFLMWGKGLYQGPTTSEFDILGFCLWRGKGNRVKMIDHTDTEVGWTIKTRPGKVQK